MSPIKGIPSIKYLYIADISGKLHMLPSVEDEVMKGHLLDDSCFCSPKWIKGERKGKIVDMCVHFVVN